MSSMGPKDILIDLNGFSWDSSIPKEPQGDLRDLKGS